MEQKELSPKQLERADTYLRRDLIVNLAQQYFRGTALVEDKPWTLEDPEQVKKFLIAAAPYSHPKIFPSYWDHVVIASIYARKVAEKAPNLGLDPNEAEALESLHDIGRLAIAHEYLRNDIVGASIFYRAGVRPQLLEKLSSVPKIIGVKVPFISRGAYRSIDDVPPTQRVLDVTDNFGKRGKSGELTDLKEHEESILQMSTRYPGGIWPSERAGRKAYTGNVEKQRFANELLSAEVAWLDTEYGIHFDELREEVVRELSKPEHQELLLALKDAQETLDLNIDEALGRPAIKAVFFDKENTLIQPVLASLQKHSPQIKTANIIFANSGIPDFAKLLEGLGPMNPESVLFIDDKEGYTTAARANFNIRGLTFRGNPYKNLSATERLRIELKKAGLI